MTYYEFYELAWNDIWDSFDNKKKDYILSKQNLKESLYCAIVSVLASVIAGKYSNDPDKIVNRIHMETDISIKTQIIENILRRLYEI